MKKITPFLWFDAPIEQVMKYYCAIFKQNAKILGTQRHGGGITTARFRLHGQEFMVFNGGPHFKFTPAISFFVDCKDQAEVDYFWNKLSKGGEKSHCGWLRDKYGISWQIIPSVLYKLLEDKDRTKAERVWQSMLQMNKIEVATLKKAYAGK